MLIVVRFQSTSLGCRQQLAGSCCVLMRLRRDSCNPFQWRGRVFGLIAGIHVLVGWGSFSFGGRHRESSSLLRLSWILVSSICHRFLRKFRKLLDVRPHHVVRGVALVVVLSVQPIGKLFLRPVKQSPLHVVRKDSGTVSRFRWTM